jgi:DNA-binding FadR family transcriptional regulator
VSYARVPSGQVGQPVRAPKTSELIAAQLRRQIVRAAVKPGEKLPPETQLMKQFGVSRPTVREAFRILETEGLIVVRPGSRGIVAVHTELRASRSSGETGSPERFRHAVKAYKELLGLIEAGDADGAQRLWRSHMDSAGAYLLKDDLRDKPVVELFA